MIPFVSQNKNLNFCVIIFLDRERNERKFERNDYILIHNYYE